MKNLFGLFVAPLFEDGDLSDFGLYIAGMTVVVGILIAIGVGAS